MTVRVLGAGLSGLSCAINLAGAGRDVAVYERRAGVGEQIKPNLQGIGFEEKFSEYGLKSPKFMKKFRKVFLLTPKRELEFTLPKPYKFILRGGKDSLEYGLYEEAEKMGVEFSFNSKLSEKESDVVATGPKKADAVAVGGVYESTNFPKDAMLIMFDDRYSPRGWYFYMVPLSENLVEAVNCVPTPVTYKAKKLFEQAISERKAIRNFMDGSRLTYAIAGYGNAGVPRKAVVDGRLYVGEAAGFQDPMMGFGIEYALESGFLAAKSITENLNYELLWRKTILPEMKKDIAKRFVLSLLGSRLIEFLYRNHKSGETQGLASPASSGLTGKMLEELFYHIGLNKKRFLGCW